MIKITGGNVGMEPQENRLSQCNEELARQDNLVNKLTDSVVELSKRLSTVLRNQGIIEQPSTKETVEDIVPLALVLRENNNNLSSLVQQLHSILSRLEL